MSVLDPAKIAEADQVMRDTAVDLNETVARIREYLATGHDPAELFLSMLTEFRALLEANRPELLAAVAAVAILRLAGVPS